MNTLPISHDTEGDSFEDDSLSIPYVDELVAEIRSRLKPGGPEIDRNLIVGYVNDLLPQAIQDEVRRKTLTWLNWWQEYRKIRAFKDLDEMNRSDASK